MQERLSNRKKPRPRLTDRIMLRRSVSEQIDGLWVGTDNDDPKSILQRLRDALALIKSHDPLCYFRLTHDLARIWARSPCHHALAGFDYRLGACVLNTRFVQAETTTLELLATVIVHEATHARLWNRGVRYDEAQRPRVEAICVRKEMEFAAKLPDGTQAYERAKQALAWCSSGRLSNEALHQRRETQDVEELRRLGVPDWAIRGIIRYRALIWRVIRFVRWAKRGFITPETR